MLVLIVLCVSSLCNLWSICCRVWKAMHLHWWQPFLQAFKHFLSICKTMEREYEFEKVNGREILSLAVFSNLWQSRTYNLQLFFTGDMTQRLCTAAELKFYFNQFLGGVSHLKPNKNCNLENWGDGCEPGWASSVGQGQQVDLRNYQDIPSRTLDSQPCCEGFFCPRGMSCMIRKQRRIQKW